MTAGVSESRRPTGEDIRHYYDSQTGRKLRDFVDGNRRVELAFKTLTDWLPPGCRSLLEVGCGIGAVSWRMAQMHPEMKVVGLDVSPVSIEIAKRMFTCPNLTFKEQLLRPKSLDDEFDCIVLMDVYEHIHPLDRRDLHAAINGVLSEHGRVVLSYPSPRKLSYLRAHQPSEIQPIDENIQCRDIGKFAEDIERDVLYLNTVDVWNSGDYCHAVIGNLGFPAPPRPTKKFKTTLINRAYEFLLRKIPADFVTPGPPIRRRLRMVSEAFGEHLDLAKPLNTEEPS